MTPVRDESRKVDWTMKLRPELLRRLRNAADRLREVPLCGEVETTASGLAEQAIDAQVKSLERRYNSGRRFPRSSKPRKVGRPARLG